MKNFFFLFILLSTLHVSAQKRIQGTVFDHQKRSLAGASVYLNNTLVGATTDDKGEFELSVKEGTYDLVVSFLGFHTVRYQLNTKDVILDPSGSIINPLDALLEGYWAYEKMADTLPLDYEPPKN